MKQFFLSMSVVALLCTAASTDAKCIQADTELVVDADVGLVPSFDVCLIAPTLVAELSAVSSAEAIRTLDYQVGSVAMVCMLLYGANMLEGSPPERSWRSDGTAPVDIHYGGAYQRIMQGSGSGGLSKL